MPSLFSRARTTSTPKKLPFLSSDVNNSTLDEFGRVSSRPTSRGGINVIIPSTPSKKDLKKRAKDLEKRSKTLGSTYNLADSDQVVDSPIPDGSFLPLNLERPKPADPDAATAVDRSKEHDYGYLSYERHVVLGLEQAERLVDVVCEELETRGGITSPFIFSTTALDISSSAIKRLIRTFLNTCAPDQSNSVKEAERKWKEEARFAGPHELGMCLRWGLARIIRSVAGQDVRGLVSWEHYVEFRDSEAAQHYPSNHFATFLSALDPPLQFIIVRVLSLLARLTANSTTSGHTPPTLSPLFGPLLFGLGPATLTFQHAYVHYLRSVNAMEHIMLAFIRWQDTPKVTSPSHSSSGGDMIFPSGSAASLGVPLRLKEWIKGYPSMLPFLHTPKNTKPEPRKGSRTVRVMSVRRNVRMYSPDLVKTASSWAVRRPGVNTNNGLASSKEWERIAPATLRLPPRYSEAFKKRMNMPPNFHPDTGTYPSNLSSAPSASSTISAATTSTLLSASSSGSNGDYFGLGLGGREGEERFRSLTDMKWGEFESMGFSEIGDSKKLQFDLTESARTERSAKRATLSWTDFSSAGFTRTDNSLSTTLEFSAPLSANASAWPAQKAELSKKLRKAEKNLPSFGWDTEPVVGTEEVIEEAFVDVFCDLVYGGGWMDLERVEELDRDCNWALVEYKSLPPSRSTASGGSDPRTSTTLVLFEEFVPLEYRQQLAVTSSSRRRLPSLFSTSNKSKQWKQAATLNGRPYVVGHVPRSPSYREVEFEGLLRGGAATKVISLGSKNPPATPTSKTAAPPAQAPAPPPLRNKISSPLYIPDTQPQPETPQRPPQQPQLPPKSEDFHSDSTLSPSVNKRHSRFKLPGGIPVPSPGGVRKAGLAPSEYSTVEFETRMASYSDDEYTSGMPEPEAEKQKRRESRDDAWVDILVNSQSRRMGGQDAELSPGERRRGVKGRRSDPDLASLEVAQVLAAIQNRSPSPPSPSGVVEDRVDRDHGIDRHVDDFDVEIETVPRTSDARSAYTDEEEDGVVLAYRDDDDEPEPMEDMETPPSPEPELTTPEQTKEQRRLGYFDLHPERRPAPQRPSMDEDPRARLARDDSDEESDDEPIQTTTTHIRPLPVPPVRDASPALQSSPEPDIIPYDPPAPVETKREPERALPLPPIPVPHGNGNGHTIAAATPAPSKTAALIEMYRERERGASPQLTPSPAPVPAVIAPLAPSRLPVRSVSLPKEPVPLPATPSPPTLTPPTLTPPLAPSPKVSPRISPPNVPGVDLPQIPFVDPGRASPARYIHGAPLHNVLEEEEEEV
ncbi:hypothetical protein BDQ12DRAFT_683547 [Crucibulum laeve]|uniref:Meiotically up-regulated protein Msb1/Mug8 domain-containing protein n=1 Tax=Crucibulum laeve TaxID=68775 RepID=A0A5C3MB31_9AGAR|nr:hypothetical protein BDQ12DRAFT_683547 [Crucibulum laeve]